MDKMNDRPLAAVEFPYAPRSLALPDHDPAENYDIDTSMLAMHPDSSRVIGMPKSKPEYLETRCVPVEDLAYHPLHPRGAAIWKQGRLTRLHATFQADGQQANLRAVMDPDGGEQLLVYSDHGLLHLCQVEGLQEDLRVEVWHLSDEQMVQAILEDETRHQALCGYERATVFKAYVDSHGGSQRDCFARLGFESESGLSRAIAMLEFDQSVLDLIVDKTAIPVGTSAKLVGLCREPRSLDLVRNWAEANRVSAVGMSPSKVIKALVDLLDPKPPAPVLNLREDGTWAYRSDTRQAPNLAFVRLVGEGQFSIELPSVAKIKSTDWTRLHKQLQAI
ncbi:MAG: hypothetical protein EOP62_00415 [Sphingomonadales bacterium]|nr:MAG: hypothetical protein EOP62_00415 [Sphingomonadales bacterium]